MNYAKKFVYITAAFLVTFFSLNVSLIYAEDIDALESIFNDDGFLLGIAFITEKSPYIGIDGTENLTVPYLAYDRGDFHIGIDGLSYTLTNNESSPISLDVIAEPRWALSDLNDSALYSDLERDVAFELGFTASLDFDIGYVELQGLKDVSNVHNGFETSFKLGTTLPIKDVIVDIGIGMAYSDSDLNQYLFGIYPEEMTTTRSSYQTKNEWKPFSELQVGFVLSKKTALFGFLNYSKYTDSVKNSPLLNQADSITAGLALVRRF